MSRPINTSLTIVAGVAAGYAGVQALSAAGNLTLNGPLVPNFIGIPDVPRRVIITSTGNDSGLVWTITGTAGTLKLNSTAIWRATVTLNRQTGHWTATPLPAQ